MNQSTTLSSLGSLLAMAVIVTVVDSYVPHDLTLVRQLLAGIQLILMLSIAAITVRSVLSDF